MLHNFNDGHPTSNHYMVDTSTLEGKPTERDVVATFICPSPPSMDPFHDFYGYCLVGSQGTPELPRKLALYFFQIYQNEDEKILLCIIGLNSFFNAAFQPSFFTIQFSSYHSNLIIFKNIIIFYHHS